MKKKSKLFEIILKSYLNKQLKEPFSVKEINIVCDNILNKSPSFVSKHCEGNPGGYSEYFKRVSRGTYIIKNYEIN